MEWRPTNPDADPQISGYHITQEFSSFVTSEQLEYKRKNMTPGMFAIAGILEIKPQMNADERRFVVRY